MKGIVGRGGGRGSARLKRADRHVKKLVKAHPDLWPAVVVHGEESWKDMPADQFDWALEEIRKREGR